MTVSPKLNFKKAMEINGISPLPHYYEEIYTNQTGLPALGMRGDKNYLFYCKGGLGAGYYEQSEEKLAADSVYDYFKLKERRYKFFTGVKDIVATMQREKKRIDNIDLNKLDVKAIAKLFVEANELHGKIFSYYIVSQPYRMRRFENQIHQELKKRVAQGRIESYINILATSNKPTRITLEEQAWLKFLQKYKAKYTSIPHDIDVLRQDYPDLYHDFMRHYNEFKVLTLGDGNWNYKIEHFLHSLEQDNKKSLSEIEKKLSHNKEQAKKSENERKNLIK